ncbi:hypothetical protein ACO2RV_17035 [Ancylobacter sp. VNQ12]|uniref:hypothetical protein n=1 Tax=Ancylobacter sp. VNQ12 TaxID=3400920 RepID=UPI003BFAB109
MSAARISIDEMIKVVDDEADRLEGMRDRMREQGPPFNPAPAARRAMVFRAIESGLIDLRNRQERQQQQQRPSR